MNKIQQRIEIALQNRLPFRNSTGSFQGIEGKERSTGDLQDGDLELYQNSVICYTVMSYDTPIAWVTHNNFIIIPDVSYSHTTTIHQNIVRANLK